MNFFFKVILWGWLILNCYCQKPIKLLGNFSNSKDSWTLIKMLVRYCKRIIAVTLFHVAFPIWWYRTNKLHPLEIQIIYKQLSYLGVSQSSKTPFLSISCMRKFVIQREIFVELLSELIYIINLELLWRRGELDLRWWSSSS